MSKIIKVNSCADCPYARWNLNEFWCSENVKLGSVASYYDSKTIHPDCDLDDLLDDSHRLKEMHKMFDEIDPTGTTADVKKD